ncbi:hypothetical protein AB0G19_29415 [Streptomyces althioticus]|uniref:hypothetical protein n=1 Tax=Streptomyces althioticus TaxID=83380 RepID=UPI0033F959F4
MVHHPSPDTADDCLADSAACVRDLAQWRAENQAKGPSRADHRPRQPEAKEAPVFPDPEPDVHAHLDADPRCICTLLRCGGSVLPPGCPTHGMTSGRTFTWHFADRCPHH